MSPRYVGTTNPAVRRTNRSAIFRAIYTSAPVARIDLAARTGLTPKTVSAIVDELIAHGLVRETGFRTSAGAGRRAVELEVDASSRFTIGVDVAHTAVSAGLVDLGGTIHRRVQGSPASRPWSTDQVVPAATDVIDRLLGDVSTDVRDRIVGIGIGAPGRYKIVDGRHLGLHHHDAAAWSPLGTTDDLDRRFGFPVTLDNNANTSALAELWFGAGKGVDDFTLINLSAGIGMGIVINGDIYRGGNHLAGEAAGHITVDASGRPCECGNVGCLHHYVSTAAVVQDAKDRIAAGQRTILPTEPTMTDLVDAAAKHDPVAESVFADAAGHLAAALISVVNTYDPRTILVGRDLPAAGAAFMVPLRTALLSRVTPALRDDLVIEAVTVADAPIIGAATLALRDFFDSPISSGLTTHTAMS